MTNVRHLPRPTRSSTFHRMALDRRRFGVALKMDGDEEGYLRALEDVRKLDEQATVARVREDRLRVQIEERRGMAAALDHILAIAQAGKGKES